VVGPLLRTVTDSHADWRSADGFAVDFGECRTGPTSRPAMGPIVFLELAVGASGPTIGASFSVLKGLNSR
jgi:hypothetical protein